jgi:hypothetical protein
MIQRLSDLFDVPRVVADLSKLKTVEAISAHVRELRTAFKDEQRIPLGTFPRDFTLAYTFGRGSTVPS